MSIKRKRFDYCIVNILYDIKECMSLNVNKLYNII